MPYDNPADQVTQFIIHQSDPVEPSVGEPPPPFTQSENVGVTNLRNSNSPFAGNQTRNQEEAPYTEPCNPVVHSSQQVRPDVESSTPRQYENVPSSFRGKAYSLTQPCQPQHDQDSATNDLTRFLLKKELLMSRFTTFNDRPETYAVWKSVFLSIKSELHVTHVEELDLLVKWLGPESSRHAISIRASNANNPARGLSRIWERLDEKFGCPELVEAALKNKLATFPKITNKDNRKLYDLSDELSEIESAMEDERYGPLLAYFNTSSGVIPIVNKLPYGLQEKWTSQAVNYKQRYHVSFPPFSYFASFIREVSKTRNDPSFMYDNSFSTLQDKDRSFNRNVPPKGYVSTRKTEINQQPSEQSCSPMKLCPIHFTRHTLNECRGFQAKSLDDRREYLKRNGVYLRCCESKGHIASACNKPLKCITCGSERHATGMHINFTTSNTPDTNSTPSALPHYGREKKEIAPVSSKCTEICGKGFCGKSCAKALLAKIFHQDQPDKSITGYIIIDDQSNQTLGKPIVFETLDIQGERIPYSLSSCSGLRFTHQGSNVQPSSNHVLIL